MFVAAAAALPVGSVDGVGGRVGDGGFGCRRWMPAESLKTSLFGHGELAGLLGARFNSVRLVFEPEHVAAALLLGETATALEYCRFAPTDCTSQGRWKKGGWAGTGRVEQV